MRSLKRSKTYWKKGLKIMNSLPRSEEQRKASSRNLRVALATPRSRKQRACSRRAGKLMYKAWKRVRQLRNNTCEVCGELCYGYKDHDHKTGKRRGILCSHCNTGIGMLKDNPEIIRRALEYLEKYKVPRFPRRFRFPRGV